MKKTYVLMIILCILFHTGLYAETKSTNEMIDEKVSKYLNKISSKSADELIAIISKSSKSVQLSSIKALGTRKSSKATNILIGVLTYAWNPKIYNTKLKKSKAKKNYNLIFDDPVRAEAAISLAKINNPKTLNVIGNTINADRSSTVRQACAVALGKMKLKEGVPYLQKAINYELKLDKPDIDNLVVIKCTKALGEIGHKDGFFVLIEVTQSTKLNYKTRKAALESLEKVKWE